MNKAILLFLFISLVEVNCFGQQAKFAIEDWGYLEKATDRNPLEFTGRDILGESSFTKDDLVAAAGSFLKSEVQELKDERSTLHLKYIKESPLGWHITFGQHFQGFAVLGASLKINLNKDATIRNTILSPSDSRFWSAQIPALNIAKPSEHAQKVLTHFNDELELGWYYKDRSHGASMHILALNDRIYVKDAKRYYTDGGPKDSLVWIYVYNPDPLTTAETEYGGAIVNDNDRDSDTLTALRVLKQVRVRYLSDSFWLENNNIKTVSRLSAFKAPSSRTDTFDYTRAMDEFEYANAFYHVSTYQDYISDLGFENMASLKVGLNARYELADNSSFNPDDSFGEGTGTLQFGYSSQGRPHVDDAEDADAIIHEYGHALSYTVNLNDFIGRPRQATEEGVCDYLACSYSKAISDYNWEKLFNWDGHNPFWEDGRMCVTSLTADDYKASRGIWGNGEIYAGAFMEVNHAIGREATDRIILASFYDYSDRMSFKTGAVLALQAEASLYNEVYHDTLCSILTDYKLVDQEDCVVSVEQVIAKQIQVKVNEWEFAKSGSLNLSFYMPFSGFVQVFDMRGREVAKEVISRDSNYSMDLSHLKKGSYLLKLQNKQAITNMKILRF